MPFQTRPQQDSTLIETDSQAARLEARILELEHQLAARTAESTYYRRLAKQAGDERLRETEEYSQLLAQLKAQLDLIAKQHDKLVALNLEIERISVTDELTQILNRRGLLARLQRLYEQCRQALMADMARANCFCALIDLDHFKRINDTHGHAAGDEVLRQMGRLFKESPYLTESDIVGRYGGEEFVCVLTRPSAAVTLSDLDRVVDQINTHRFEIPNGEGLRLTVSIGVATIERYDKDPFDVIGRADRALYQAKQQGRNRIVGIGRCSERKSLDHPRL